MRRNYVATTPNIQLTAEQADKLEKIKGLTQCKTVSDTIRMLIDSAEITPVISYTYTAKLAATPDAAMKSHERCVFEWLKQNGPATTREIAGGIGRRMDFVNRIIGRYKNVFLVSETRRTVKGYSVPMYQIQVDVEE